MPIFGSPSGQAETERAGRGVQNRKRSTRSFRPPNGRSGQWFWATFVGMETLLTTTAYFPPLAWYRRARSQGQWQFEGAENYQKGGWRNRCKILTANGPLLLSVPLRGGKHQQQPIQEVLIDYRTDWPITHERTIQAAYGRAPFFDFYAPDIFSLLRTRPPTLWSLNWQLRDLLAQQLGLPVDLSYSENFGGVIFLATSVPPYPQVFSDRHGFTDGLSVLDGLLCAGPSILL